MAFASYSVSFVPSPGLRVGNLYIWSQSLCVSRFYASFPRRLLTRRAYDLFYSILICSSRVLSSLYVLMFGSSGALILFSALLVACSFDAIVRLWSRCCDPTAVYQSCGETTIFVAYSSYLHHPHRVLVFLPDSTGLPAPPCCLCLLYLSLPLLCCRGRPLFLMAFSIIMSWLISVEGFVKFY